MLIHRNAFKNEPFVPSRLDGAGPQPPDIPRRENSRRLIHDPDKKLYLKMHHKAWKPSRQPTFLPSA